MLDDQVPAARTLQPRNKLFLNANADIKTTHIAKVLSRPSPEACLRRTHPHKVVYDFRVSVSSKSDQGMNGIRGGDASSAAGGSLDFRSAAPGLRNSYCRRRGQCKGNRHDVNPL